MKWLSLASTWLFLPWSLGQEVVIVTSQDTRLDRLSLFQLQQIYLGKLDVLEGQTLQAMDLKPGDPLRVKFEQEIFGSKINLTEYWIQQRLRAEAEPPIQISNWSLMLLYASHNPGYLAYIDKEKLDQLKHYRLKVIPIQ